MIPLIVNTTICVNTPHDADGVVWKRVTTDPMAPTTCLLDRFLRQWHFQLRSIVCKLWGVEHHAPKMVCWLPMLGHYDVIVLARKCLEVVCLMSSKNQETVDSITKNIGSDTTSSSASRLIELARGQTTHSTRESFCGLVWSFFEVQAGSQSWLIHIIISWCHARPTPMPRYPR